MSKTNTGRNVAMALGGLACGIVGGRLVPPLVGIALGWKRVRAGGDPFAMLIHDHRKIASLLDQMLAGSGSRLQRGRLFLMLKRKLAKHAMAEEDVVYPILHNQSDEIDNSKHLYDEHADMKILLYELESRVQTGNGWTETVRSLQDLIGRHISEEENTIFPRLRARLGESRLPAVSGQISREEALIV